MSYTLINTSTHKDDAIKYANLSAPFLEFVNGWRMLKCWRQTHAKFIVAWRIRRMQPAACPQVGRKA
jgi:hypothetical protein